VRVNITLAENSILEEQAEAVSFQIEKGVEDIVIPYHKAGSGKLWLDEVFRRARIKVEERKRHGLGRVHDAVGDA
jgi:hypothetical protein